MAPPTTTLRPARLSDASAIVAIYAPAVLQSAASFEIEVPTVDEMRRRIIGIKPRMPWYVAEAEAKVVGYAYSTQHRARPAYQWTAEVSVYVESTFHHSGLGRALYDTLLARLRVLGYRAVVAGIVLPNPASTRLHENQGFRSIGVFHNLGFKFGRWHDVGWWELDLNDGDDSSPSEAPASEADPES